MHEKTAHAEVQKTLHCGPLRGGKSLRPGHRVPEVLHDAKTYRSRATAAGEPNALDESPLGSVH